MLAYVKGAGGVRAILAFNRGRLTVEPVNAPSQGLVGKMSP